MTFPKRDGQALAKGVPLAKIYKREIEHAPQIVMLSDSSSVIAERFRRLKTTLIHKYGNELQVIVVTSSVPGEGKSTVAMNLALAFAGEAVEATLLIDADMRRPTIGSYLKPSPQLGFSELLGNNAELDHVVCPTKGTSLIILPAGSNPGDPLELLAAQRARSVFAELRKRYTRIIVDTPPIVPFTDADVLGALSDGVLVVAREDVTPYLALKQGLASVTSTRVLGAVLNGASKRFPWAGGYHEKYYRHYYDRERKK